MKKIIFGLIIISQVLFAQLEEYKQTFISLKNTGVQEFLEEHPEYDGRGTIILILDSGVDIGIEGLTETTTGEDKVIDVQDFSGEGTTKFYEADIDDIDDVNYVINEDIDYKVKGVDDIALKPADDEYYIGALDEKMWMNSGARTTDLNGNGTSDDKFFYITFQAAPDDWVVYIDTDSDGSIADEVPLKNYKIDHDKFQIKNELEAPEYTFALNIFPDSNEVVFHYDAVAHGTHCAGIAAGNKIGNNDFSGVAPGANLGSLKIGSSVFSGGSTVTGSMKAAYDYADKMARERKEPVIINMSYGIGSEIEGMADMEKYLEQLVSANPYLYISTSNGNEGPGISTTGLPASSPAILSSGAVLAKELGADLYGADLDRDVILHFSSRGGEVNKPDVVSPGAATSTVPAWTGYDRFWGTSMASPYSAGVMSLLLSAMQKEYPDVKIPSLLVYKALHESAVPMEGYTPLDQGGGLININNAYKLLKKYIDEGEIDKFETYTISSFAPNTPSGSAPNLYIRNGSYLDGKETFSYRIRRNNFNKKDKFYRTYNIKSDSDWLIPITKNTYIRNSQATGVSVRIDPSILSRPGLYCGRIKAYRADKTKFPEFEMLATIVIPEHFNESNNYELSFEGDLAPAAVKRYFLNIPAGATAMKVNLSYDKGEYSNTWYSLHDPAGRGVSTIRPLESEKNEKEDTEIYYDLLPGVYELDVVGYYRATDTVDYNLNVKFLSIEKAGDVTITDDDNTVAVVDRYTNTERYNLGGKLLGYEKNYKEVINQPVYKKPFTLKRSEKEKTFNLTVSGEDFNKVTDFAVQIIDEDGKIVSSNGFSYDNMSISINNSYDNDEVNLILQYVPAYVDEPKEITVYVNEVTDLKEPVTLDVRNKGNDSIVLYPSVVEDIEVNYEKPELDFPEDSVPYGKIIFESPETGDTEYELPIYFNL